ncbi:MAG: AAA family ATPase [Opitutae bacterium]|nr:AAA family ATPase [Opitutae bacterium]
MLIERRKYLERIRDRLGDYPIVALLGPRQVGKTTLAKLLAQFASDEEVHHIDLESPGDLARLANPELVLSPLKS